MEIIPAILVKSEAEFHRQLKLVEPFVKWVQLDVVDGDFAPNLTWGDPRVVRSVDTNVKFEIDLMVSNVLNVISEWILPATLISRIFFHQEAAKGQEESIIKKVKKAGIEVGVSLVPETPLDNVLPYLAEVDAVLLLGVPPGFQGQRLQEEVIDNVRSIHSTHPGLPIEIDGGVKPENIRRLVEAGVSRVAVGSYIFEHPDGPKAAIQELQSRAESAL